MNKLIMIALATTLSMSANGGELIKDEAVAKPFVDACLSEIKSRLKDSDSMKVGEDISALRNDDGTTNAYIRVNAKNGFGGYTGYKLYVCKFDSNLEIVMFFYL
jgi:hypothetical protein